MAAPSASGPIQRSTSPTTGAATVPGAVSGAIARQSGIKTPTAPWDEGGFFAEGKSAERAGELAGSGSARPVLSEAVTGWAGRGNQQGRNSNG